MRVDKRIEWCPAQCGADPVVLLDPAIASSVVLKEIQGFDAPVYSFDSIATPGVDGVSFGPVVTTRPRMVVPMLIRAESRSEMRRVKARVVAAMVPEDGPGRLVVSDDIGSDTGASRYIEAIYRGGLEGDGANGGLDRWWRFDLAFECGDPYWYNTDPATAVWLGPASRPMFPMVLNNNRFVLNSYGLTATEVLDLDGDRASFATYNLNGPWWRAKFTNTRTGEWWEILRAPDVNEGLEVVTKPGSREVTNAAGESRWGFTAGSVLFAIRPGDSIVAEADGAGQFTRFDLRVWAAWNLSS